MQYTTKYINKHFGQIIKKYRENMKLSQESLAEKLNISAKFLSRIENGITGTSYETLLKLIDFLGIPPNILYDNLVSNDIVKENIKISEEYNRLNKKQKNFFNIMLKELKKM